MTISSLFVKTNSVLQSDISNHINLEAFEKQQQKSQYLHSPFPSISIFFCLSVSTFFGRFTQLFFTGVFDS